MNRWTIAACIVGLTACSEPDDGKQPLDMADPQDQGELDMGSTPDTGPPDAQVPDAAMSDVGRDDAGDAGPADAGPDMASTCSRNGLMPVMQSVSWTTGGNYLIYSGFNAEPAAGQMYDFLSFEIYPDFGGAVEPQSYTFPGQNYSECGTCLLVFADCTQGMGCAKVFLVDAGSVELTAVGTGMGDPFAATFSNLVFSEVTVDPDTFASTKVVGGETYCIDAYTATAATEVTE